MLNYKEVVKEEEPMREMWKNCGESNNNHERKERQNFNVFQISSQSKYSREWMRSIMKTKREMETEKVLSSCKLHLAGVQGAANLLHLLHLLHLLAAETQEVLLESFPNVGNLD